MSGMGFPRRDGVFLPLAITGFEEDKSCGGKASTCTEQSQRALRVRRQEPGVAGVEGEAVSLQEWGPGGQLQAGTTGKSSAFFLSWGSPWKLLHGVADQAGILTCSLWWLC